MPSSPNTLPGALEKKLQQLTHSPVQSAPACSSIQVHKSPPSDYHLALECQEFLNITFPVPDHSYKAERAALLGGHQSEQQSLSNSRLRWSLSLTSTLTWSCVRPLRKAKPVSLLREAGSLNLTSGSPWPDKRMQTVKYLCPISWVLHKTTWVVLHMSMGVLRTRHP